MAVVDSEKQKISKEDWTVNIDKYSFPDDLLYDKEHNWARIEGSVVTIGMTDFGQALAGDIVYAEVPKVGRAIKAGDAFMSLESGKWVGRVKAIVTGKIAEANEELEWESGLINSDPYGEGWMLRISLADAAQAKGVSMTPTLIVAGASGQEVVPGYVSFDDLKPYIERALGGATPTAGSE
mgnify:CR=1 FL=1